MSRLTIVRIAAFASSVVASIPTVVPFTSPASANRFTTHPNTSWCASSEISLLVLEIVECSGVASLRL
ncbi:MAG: hypothetical protein R2729_28515 [Bryobacteraceae bacterium]